MLGYAVGALLQTRAAYPDKLNEPLCCGSAQAIDDELEAAARSEPAPLTGVVSS